MPQPQLHEMHGNVCIICDRNVNALCTLYSAAQHRHFKVDSVVRALPWLMGMRCRIILNSYVFQAV
jgi:hypothetical protein